MKFERFSQGASLLHRRDARVKLVSALLLALAISASRSFPPALTGLAVGLGLVLLARLEARPVLLRLLVVNGFIGFLWITLPLTYPGRPWLLLGTVALSSEGIALAALITVKANAIIMLLMALLATSTVADLGHGLSRLKIPAKFCLLLLFSYRYIFVISEEYQRLVRAARLRCFRPATTLHTYRTFGYLFGMTLVNSWQRADRVSQAMLLRGFDGQFRTLSESTIHRHDLLFLAFTVGLAATIVATGIMDIITS